MDDLHYTLQLGSVVVGDLDLKRYEPSSNGLHLVRGGRAPLLLCLLQAVRVACSASQPVVPTDFSAGRERMVEELSAPARGIKNRLVLNAMNTVPRHEFVPQSLRQFAYRDEPLLIGGQSISQPFVVAFMTEQLDPKLTGTIIEHQAVLPVAFVPMTRKPESEDKP